MAITDKTYLQNHRQLVSRLDARFPKRAFAGATLEVLSGSEGLDRLDDDTRDDVVAFAEDFLTCDCPGRPHCGCPERAFVRYLLDRRAQGLGPDGIVDAMGEEYGLYAYPGDVLSFLDDAVRTLEAASRLATVDDRPSSAERIDRVRRDLTG